MFFWHSQKYDNEEKNKKYTEKRSRTQFMKTLDWDSN